MKLLCFDLFVIEVCQKTYLTPVNAYISNNCRPCPKENAHQKMNVSAALI